MSVSNPHPRSMDKCWNSLSDLLETSLQQTTPSPCAPQSAQPHSSKKNSTAMHFNFTDSKNPPPATCSCTTDHTLCFFQRGVSCPPPATISRNLFAISEVSQKVPLPPQLRSAQPIAMCLYDRAHNTNAFHAPVFKYLLRTLRCAQRCCIQF